MATIRDQVVDLAIGFLNTSPPGGVPNTRRGYLFSPASGDLPTIGVYPERDDFTLEGRDNVGVLVRNKFFIVAEVRAQSDASNSADKNAEPLLSWIFKALNGKRAAANTGLFHLMWIDNVEWNYDQMEHGYVLVKVKVGVSYQTKAGDPESWA